MYCTNCGSEVPPDDAFCTNCGEKVTPEGPEATQVSGAPTAPEQAAPQPPSAAAPPPSAAAPPPSAAPPPAAAAQTPSAPAQPAPPPIQPTAVEPAVQPPGPTLPPPGPPPAAPGVAPEKKKGGRKWLAGVLIGAAVVVVVAVVLVLVLVVFKGGGPEATARNLYKATEKADLQALIALVDTSELSKQAGLKAKFTDYIKQNLTSGLKITDLKFETKVDGNNATVTAVSGKVTYTDKSGKKSTEDITKLGQGANIVYVVKKDDKWYVDTKTFPDFYAKEYLTEADAAMAKLETDITAQSNGIGSTLSQGMQGASSYQELDARFKSLAGGIDTTLTNLRKQAEDTKAKYKSVESLQNVKEYQNYASLRSQTVDALIETIDKLGKELQELGGYITGLSANPPTTTNGVNAAQQGADNIQTTYNAQFTALQQKATDLENQANDLKDTLGL